MLLSLITQTELKRIENKIVITARSNKIQIQFSRKYSRIAGNSIEIENCFILYLCLVAGSNKSNCGC